MRTAFRIKMIDSQGQSSFYTNYEEYDTHEQALRELENTEYIHGNFEIQQIYIKEKPSQITKKPIKQK